MMRNILICLVVALLLTVGESFQGSVCSRLKVSHTPLLLAGKPGIFPDPKNTKGGNGKPSYADPEIADIGWGPAGSLIRQGPVPFFIRIVKPETYEAAVSKYMAQEKCDRATAQGNMDAYFQGKPITFNIVHLLLTKMQCVYPYSSFLYEFFMISTCRRPKWMGR